MTDDSTSCASARAGPPGLLSAPWPKRSQGPPSDAGGRRQHRHWLGGRSGVARAPSRPDVRGASTRRGDRARPAHRRAVHARRSVSQRRHRSAVGGGQRCTRRRCWPALGAACCVVRSPPRSSVTDTAPSWLQRMPSTVCPTRGCRSITTSPKCCAPSSTLSGFVRCSSIIRWSHGPRRCCRARHANASAPRSLDLPIDAVWLRLHPFGTANRGPARPAPLPRNLPCVARA